MISTSLLTCDPTTMPNDPSIPNPITTSIGTVWTMQQPGVTLTMPQHTDSNIHATLVLHGQLAVVTNTDTTPSATILYNAGDVIDFSSANALGVCTLTSNYANTIFVTVVKVAANMSAVSANLTTLITTAQTIKAEIAALATVNQGSNPTT